MCEHMCTVVISLSEEPLIIVKPWIIATRQRKSFRPYTHTQRQLCTNPHLNIHNPEKGHCWVLRICSPWFGKCCGLVMSVAQCPETLSHRGEENTVWLKSVAPRTGVRCSEASAGLAGSTGPGVPCCCAG